MPIYKTLDGDMLIPEGDLLTKREIAKEIGVSISTMQRWQRQGLPFVEYSNNINGYVLADVLAWVKQNKKAIQLRKRGKKNDGD